MYDMTTFYVVNNKSNTISREIRSSYPQFRKDLYMSVRRESQVPHNQVLEGDYFKVVRVQKIYFTTSETYIGYV